MGSKKNATASVESQRESKILDIGISIFQSYKHANFGKIIFMALCNAVVLTEVNEIYL